MILAAGIGSRLKPLTDKTPKALVKIGNHKMIDLAFAYLLKHGVDEIIINVHHLADQLMEWVAEKRWEGYNVQISDETGELLNTGGGLLKASYFLKQGDDFVLMAVDILTDLDLSGMIKQHQESSSLVTLAVKERETSRNLLFDQEGYLAGWVHNQTGDTKLVKGRSADKALAFSGVHVISSEIFSLIEETGAFSIIDLYLRLARMQKIQKFDHSPTKWLEFGRAERISEIKDSPEFKNLIEGLFT